MTMSGSAGFFPPNLKRWPILGEGDSYMSQTGNGLLLLSQLQISTFFMRQMYSTAVAGSTITDIYNRLLAQPTVIAASTCVIWDGDANGFTTLAAYKAVIDQILGLTGTTRVVYLRPCTRGPSADGQVSQLTLDEEAIYSYLVSLGVPTFEPVSLINTLNNGSPQDLLDMQARVICTSCLQGDLTHLTTPAKNIVANAIAAKLAERGI